MAKKKDERKPKTFRHGPAINRTGSGFHRDRRERRRQNPKRRALEEMWE